MKQKYKIIYLLNFIAIYLLISGSSCNNGYLYNPALNLPIEIAKKNDIQISGYISAAPEALPSQRQKSTSIAAYGLLRFSPADDYLFETSYLCDLSDINNQYKRQNLSFSILSNFYHNNNDYHLGLKVNYQRSWGIGDGGEGVGIQLIGQLPKIQSLRPYFGFGFAYGGKTNEWNLQNGFGIVSNFGLSFKIKEIYFINAELIPIIQINRVDNITHGIISANIGTGIYF